METTQSLVKFKIIESTGFSSHEKPATEALEFIRAYIQQKGGWFYINGSFINNIDTITPQMLDDAGSIAITNIVQGGADRS